MWHIASNPFGTSFKANVCVSNIESAEPKSVVSRSCGACGCCNVGNSWDEEERGNIEVAYASTRDLSFANMFCIWYYCMEFNAMTGHTLFSGDLIK